MIFSTTKNILFELGASSKLGSLLATHSLKRPLFVTDTGIVSNNLLSSATKSLAIHNIYFSIFSGVVPDPTEQNIADALSQAKSYNADCVIGFGGGSSLDVAKVVAYLAHDANSCSRLSDMYGVGKCGVHRLPLFQVPTTAGTGSEVTPISIVTTGPTSKMGIVSPVLLPDAAVLDGELTYSVPPHVTAHTGVDAMVHAIEAYTNSAGRKNVISDALAREALRLLSRGLVPAVTAGKTDGQARGDMLLGSMLAGMAFANSPVAAVHALAYPLGAGFKVPHGLSCSLMLPPVMKFNAKKCSGLYSEIAGDIFKKEMGHYTEQQIKSDHGKICDEFIERMEGLLKEVGIPDRLSAVGVKKSDVEMLSTESMKQVRLLPNNPRVVDLEDARAIYSSIL